MEETRPEIQNPVFAVRCRNVHFVYKKGVNRIVALNGLNLNVPCGCIYGLLGPSGCGKTTLLKTILMRQKPQSGSVTVYGCEPGKLDSGIPGIGIGYMPQDIALLGDMTIGETLEYYGALYNLDKKTIRERSDHLLEALHLPSKDSFVANLSSGQQRRVSFSLTVIHMPRLLILDEPTVGVDPLLRKVIWGTLVQYTKEQKMTVILTTHYLDETRKADYVGFMKQGELYIEENPETLIKAHNAKSLDEVFYKYCLTLEDRKSVAFARLRRASLYTNMQIDRVQQPKEPLPYPSRCIRVLQWLRLLFILTSKALLLSRRNLATILVQLILPLITIAIYAACVGPMPHYVNLNIVNEESPPELSQLFLNTLDQYSYSMKQVSFQNFEDAMKSARAGQAAGVIRIHKNFTESILTRCDYNEWYIDNETILTSTITLHPDTVDKFSYMIVNWFYEQSFLEFLNRLRQRLGVNSLAIDIPVEVRDAINEPDSAYFYADMIFFYTIGFIVIINYVTSFGTTVLLVLGEKLDNVFDRNYAAGVTPALIIFSHFFSRLVYAFLTTLLIYLFSTHIFDVPQRGETWLAFVCLWLQSAVGLCHGLVTSAAFESFASVAMAGQGVVIFLFEIGGILWPVEAMPYWIIPFTRLTPINIPCDALRCIFLKSWNLSNWFVVLGIGISLGWIVVFLAISIYLLAMSK